ncbi:hypothetical protein ACX9NE_13205 [Mycobacterium sp. ML4]
MFKAEAAELDESEPDLSEVLIHTAKLTQPSTADQLAHSVNRAIIRPADIGFVAEAAPVGPAVAPMPGLLNVANIVEGGEVATDLDQRLDRHA